MQGWVLHNDIVKSGNLHRVRCVQLVSVQDAPPGMTSEVAIAPSRGGKSEYKGVVYLVVQKTNLYRCGYIFGMQQLISYVWGLGSR